MSVADGSLIVKPSVQQPLQIPLFFPILTKPCSNRDVDADCYGHAHGNSHGYLVADANEHSDAYPQPHTDDNPDSHPADDHA